MAIVDLSDIFNKRIPDADKIMFTTTYDTNEDGIVDMAEDSQKVNGHTVDRDVPANADFTSHVDVNNHMANTNNPHNVTQAQVGLSEVDNTSDADKPISNATQVELNKKLEIVATDSSLEGSGTVADPLKVSPVTNQEVIFVDTQADLPPVGDSEVLYVVREDNIGFRWDDTTGQYVNLGTVKPVGNDKEVQFNDNGIMGAVSDFIWDKVNKLLSVFNLQINNALEMSHCTNQSKGVFYKDTKPFLHDFSHPTGDTAVPLGNNVFLGYDVGNFTMGQNATIPDQASNNIFIGDNIGLVVDNGFKNSFIGSNLAINTSYPTYCSLVGSDLAMNAEQMSRCVIKGFDIANTDINNNPVTSMYYCTMIGANIRCSTDYVTNENIIGYSAEGKGNDTFSFGNANIKANYFNGDIVSDTGNLDIGKNINLEHTFDTETGVITKNGVVFLHDFAHPTGNTAVPTGFNMFIGRENGNFTLGQNADNSWEGSFNNFVGSRNGTMINNGYHNAFFGYRNSPYITDGNYNTSIGDTNLLANETGVRNTVLGTNNLGGSTSPRYDVTLGYNLLPNATTTFNCTIIGDNFNKDSNDNNILEADYVISIGSANKPKNDASYNEVIIGNWVVGNGNNTTTIGSDTTTSTHLAGFTHCKKGIGVDTIGEGYYTYSDNGKLWRIRVADDGSLFTEEMTTTMPV